MNVMKEKDAQSNIFSINDDLGETMRQSFEYWHKKYNDSFINYPLVWKKALESDTAVLEKIEELRKNCKQNTDMVMEQFFEMWSYAIKKSNFGIAMESMQEWEEFWRNTTEEQFKMCTEIFQMIEKYWKNILDKNIE